MKSREIWKKQHKNLYRFFSGKSLRRFFFMCFRMKTFQENEQIYYFLFFFFLRNWGDIIFSCVKPSGKKNNPYSFWGFFSGKHFRGIFYHLEKCERISEEILSTFSMWNWVKKKKCFSFWKKTYGGILLCRIISRKKKKTHPDFFSHVNPSE